MLGQVIGQLLVLHWFTEQVSKHSVQDGAFSNITEDIDVVATQVVHVVGMALELIHVFG